MGLPLAGPTAAAARLEGSKAFAKQFMQRHGIPTAACGIFDNASAAEAYINEHPQALVVKADGLAAGKGVFVCSDAEEAKTAVRMLLRGDLGAAGQKVVVEAKLQGEEASFMVLTDGQRIWPLAGSQDHKALNDGNTGPNTGGMGAYSPAPVMDDALSEKVMAQVVEPTIRGMAEEGCPFQGILYVGLMIQGQNFYALEYNCRLGDPETQPLLARLESDLVPYLAGLAEGKLPAEALRWDPRTALCVVLAAQGYPGPYETGFPIQGIEEAESQEGAMVFHAGTDIMNGRLVTKGGRVLGVTALGTDIKRAQDRAYQATRCIHWPGMHYRKDIGNYALQR